MICYVLVGQHNHRKVTARREDGSPLRTNILHRMPISIVEARKLAEKAPTQYEFVQQAGHPLPLPTRRGFITYQVQRDGSLSYVADDADSSG